MNNKYFILIKEVEEKNGKKITTLEYSGDCSEGMAKMALNHLLPKIKNMKID